MSEAVRPARLPREERREHFLDVATQLVAERGVDALTMESVAAAAGVSKGLGYAYFDNRGALLLAVLQRELSSLERRVGEAMAEAETFEERIRAAVTAWLDAVAERGGVMGTLLQASQIQKPLQNSRHVYYRRLEEFYGRMAEEELGIPRQQAVAAAAILLAGLAGVLERWLTARDSRPLLEDTFVELAMGGLRGLADRAESS